MDRIAQANIDRFNLILETERDPSKRSMIARLLREERAKRRLSSESDSADDTKDPA